MAKVYSPPKELPTPIPDYMKPGRGWMEDEKKWEESLRQYCVANGGKDEAVGTVIGFPVADGSAQYMVFSISPLVLIHMPLGDAWQYRYINRLTKKDILEQVRQLQGDGEAFQPQGSPRRSPGSQGFVGLGKGHHEGRSHTVQVRALSGVWSNLCRLAGRGGRKVAHPAATAHVAVQRRAHPQDIAGDCRPGKRQRGNDPCGIEKHTDLAKQ